VRRKVASEDVPSLTVPFSALEGAGIDFDSIRPIHVREDRFTIEEHSSRIRPAKLAQMLDPTGATRGEMQWRYNHEACKREQVEVQVPVYVPDPNRTVPFPAAHDWCEGGAKLGEGGVWRWKVRRHWLGDSLFRARYSEDRTRKPTAQEVAEFEEHRVWELERQRLRKNVEDLHAKSWKLDDRYGPPLRWNPRAPRPRYSPDANYGAMFRRMFAAAGFLEQAHQVGLILDEHNRKQIFSNGMRGGRMPIRVTRWATFLSSFDYQETRPLYFLCELPYGAKPATVDDAIEALKPPEVVAALARGLDVIRQGDLFAIPTKLTKRQIRRMQRKEDFTKRLRVLGTNHSVTEGVILKGGAVLGRGIMRHEPESWRPPDHKRVKLGDGKAWYMLVRNTVPRTH
jgi:hypothetical protein